MKIGELSKLSGCSIQTIRYYEKEKLLSPPMRSEGNFRLYDKKLLEQLLFIKQCRSLDITLSEIKQLIHLKNSPQADCTDITKIIEMHVQQVDLRLTDLMQLKESLHSLKKKCSTGNIVENCGIIKNLANISKITN